LAPCQAPTNAAITPTKSSQNPGCQAYDGIPEFRDSIVKFYKEFYGIDLNNDEVLPLMGSKEGVLHLTLAFVNPGDTVMIPNPGYPTYSSLTRLLGADVRPYDLSEASGWYPDFEKMADSDLSNVKMLWLNYPHMPTGTPASMKVFDEAIKFANNHNLLICHDNPYSLVLNNDKPISIFAADGAKDVAVELNSLSKSHNMAGWRVGMLVGAQDYVKTALRVKSNIDSGMYRGIQNAAIAALADSQDWHDLRNEEYRERKQLVYQLLDKLDCSYSTNQEGMFVWAKPNKEEVINDIPAFIDQTLEEKYIFITPGNIFGSNGEGYIRISLCVNSENIKKALSRF